MSPLPTDDTPADDGASAAREQAALTSTIGPGILVRGVVHARRDLIVHGTIEGPVELPGALIVGPLGRVASDVRCAVVDVSGALRGGVVASPYVQLRAGADVFVGAIATRRLAIEEGARVRCAIAMDVELPAGVAVRDAGDDEGGAA